MYQDPQNMRFGGGAGQTFVDLYVFIALVITVLLTFILPRKYVIVPLLLMAVVSPNGQQFYVAGVHLYIGRLLVLFTWMRIVLRKSSDEEIVSGGWNGIDKIFVAWAIFRAIGNRRDREQKTR